MSEKIYHQQLLEHYKKPRNIGDVSGAQFINEGFNANCGDKVKIGIFVENKQINKVRYQVRGCAICTASTSLMSELLTGLSISAALKALNQLNLSLSGEAQWPKGCEALSGAATIRGRQKCISLSWQTCEQILTFY